jgi:DNA-binding SARP family transcriptional activator/TolB-like protein
MLRGNRLRLVTLGRLTLLGASGEEDVALAKRRLKLAVLAILAMARRPVSRDALLAMFWGEQSEERARHSLSNALSSLRRALGQRSITTRDADVSLVPDIELDVDALDLQEAVEGRDWARAVEVYAGPFLDGVNIDGSSSFEQWVTRERRRLERLFVQACTQQCAVLARARKWTECHALAARWLDAEPLSSDAAIYLLNATKAPGTRASLALSIEEYELLRVRLERDFELAPEPSVRELAERIREQLATVPESAPETPRPPETVASSAIELPAPTPHAGAATAVSSDEPTSSFVRAHDKGRRVLWELVGATLAISLLALGGVFWSTRRTNANAVGRNSGKAIIAVLAMQVRTTDSTLAWLADGLPQMVSGMLAHSEEVEVVSPTQVRAVLVRSGHTGNASLDDATARDLARRVGATMVARGAIGRDGGNLVMELSIHDVGSGRLVLNAVITRNDVLALADEAAARILGVASASAPGPQYAELETSSLDAFKHYMRALDAGRAGRLSEYQHELDAAISLDSGFIAAVRARITSAINDNDSSLTRRLRDTMRRYAQRATEFDRLHQEALDAHWAGERERSEALARGLVRRYPRDPRAYDLLENVLASHGDFDGASRVAAEGVALDSAAMEAGTGPCTPCLGFSSIIGMDWARANLRGAAEWSRRWIRAQPDAPGAWSALAWTLAYAQRTDSALPFMQRAVSLSGGDRWAVEQLARMLLLARQYETADSVIMAMLADPLPASRDAAADLRALLERERGRIRGANRAVDRWTAIAPGSAGFAEMVRADNFRLLGDYTGSARRYEAAVHSPFDGPMIMRLPAPAARAFCWHHALAADAYAGTGDTITLRAKADTLEAVCARSYYGRDWGLSHHVRGLIAMKGQRFTEAEREFKQAMWTKAEGWSRTTVELAEAQRALGRPLEAIATLRLGYATRLDAMGRYVPISELDFHMSTTFAQAGESDSARVYAGYVRRAWRDADPEMRRLLTQLP